MKITAVSISRPRLLSRSVSTTRVLDFLALMKPRVMLLAVFTAFVGMMIAPVSPDPLLGSLAMIAIAVGAGAAGVLVYMRAVLVMRVPEAHQVSRLIRAQLGRA